MCVFLTHTFKDYIWSNIIADIHIYIHGNIAHAHTPSEFLRRCSLRSPCYEMVPVLGQAAVRESDEGGRLSGAFFFYFSFAVPTLTDSNYTNSFHAVFEHPFIVADVYHWVCGCV